MARDNTAGQEQRGGDGSSPHRRFFQGTSRPLPFFARFDGRNVRIALSAVLLFALSAASAQTNQFSTTIRPVFDEYCAKCHGPTRAKGGINLAGFTNTVSVYREPGVWQKVISKVQAKEMPPEDKPQPSLEQRDNLVRWAQKTLDDLEQGRFAADPGRVRIHRLSRTEYNCTIRDLLGVDTHPADTFPTEGGGGGGFDNNADTLFLPPILMERYLAAATTVLAQAPKEKIFFTKKSWLTSERSFASAGMRDGNAHNPHNLPLVLAGRAGDTIASGRHLVYEKNTPLRNLYQSMLAKMGAPVERFSDSTGELVGLNDPTYHGVSPATA